MSLIYLQLFSRVRLLFYLFVNEDQVGYVAIRLDNNLQRGKEKTMQGEGCLEIISGRNVDLDYEPELYSSVSYFKCCRYHQYFVEFV